MLGVFFGGLCQHFPPLEQVADIWMAISDGMRQLNVNMIGAHMNPLFVRSRDHLISLTNLDVFKTVAQQRWWVEAVSVNKKLELTSKVSARDSLRLQCLPPFQARRWELFRPTSLVCALRILTINSL